MWWFIIVANFGYLTISESHEVICLCFTIFHHNFVFHEKLGLIFMFCFNKLHKKSWPLWWDVNLFPARGEGFRFSVTWQWTKKASRSTPQVLFQAVLGVLSRTLILRLAEKWCNIHVLVDIFKTAAPNLDWIVPFIAHKVLLIAIYSCCSESVG